MPHSFRHDGLNDTYDLFQAPWCRTSRLKHMLFLRQIRYFRTLIGYTSSLLRVVSRLDVACKPKRSYHNEPYRLLDSMCLVSAPVTAAVWCRRLVLCPDNNFPIENVLFGILKSRIATVVSGSRTRRSILVPNATFSNTKRRIWGPKRHARFPGAPIQHPHQINRINQSINQ